MPSRTHIHTNLNLANLTRILLPLAGALALILAALACVNQEFTLPSVSDATPNPARVKTGTVGPDRFECYNPNRKQCLVIDGVFFFDEIDGFTHEPGYEYRIRYEEYDAYPGQEPPQGAPEFGYRLIEIISKTPATSRLPRPLPDNATAAATAAIPPPAPPTAAART